ncbi:MAG TPA: globin family protein [Polyangiales bacterium]|nr:globin family protein [Polyangiales bacterium]
MDPATVDTLRSSFARIAAQKVDVAAIFYQRLFEVAPGVRPLFEPDTTEQQKKLLASLARIVQTVDNPDQLVPYLSDLGRRHLTYGAKPEHYAVVGEVLLWTFEKVLGPEFTPEIRKAWGAAYGAVAELMCEAAEGATPT